MTHDAAVKAAQRAVTADTGPITVFFNKMDGRYLTKFGDGQPLGGAWRPYSVIGIDGIEVSGGTDLTAEAKALAAQSAIALPSAIAAEPLSFEAGVKAIAQFLIARPDILQAITKQPNALAAVAGPPLDSAVPPAGRLAGVKNG